MSAIGLEPFSNNHLLQSHPSLVQTGSATNFSSLASRITEKPASSSQLIDFYQAITRHFDAAIALLLGDARDLLAQKVHMINSAMVSIKHLSSNVEQIHSYIKTLQSVQKRIENLLTKSNIHIDPLKNPSLYTFLNNRQKLAERENSLHPSLKKPIWMSHKNPQVVMLRKIDFVRDALFKEIGNLIALRSAGLVTISREITQSSLSSMNTSSAQKERRGAFSHEEIESIQNISITNLNTPNSHSVDQFYPVLVMYYQARLKTLRVNPNPCTLASQSLPLTKEKETAAPTPFHSTSLALSNDLATSEKGQKQAKSEDSNKRVSKTSIEPTATQPPLSSAGAKDNHKRASKTHVKTKVIPSPSSSLSLSTLPNTIPSQASLSPTSPLSPLCPPKRKSGSDTVHPDDPSSSPSRNLASSKKSSKQVGSKHRRKGIPKRSPKSTAMQSPSSSLSPINLSKTKMSQASLNTSSPQPRPCTRKRKNTSTPSNLHDTSMTSSRNATASNKSPKQVEAEHSKETTTKTLPETVGVQALLSQPTPCQLPGINLIKPKLFYKFNMRHIREGDFASALFE